MLLPPTECFLPLLKVVFEVSTGDVIDFLKLDPVVDSEYPVDRTIMINDRLIHVVVCSEAPCTRRKIYRFDLKFIAIVVFGIRTFSTWYVL